MSTSHETRYHKVRTHYLRQNASVRHVCKYHCLRQVYLLAHDSIRKRGNNNDKHRLHFIFFGWDGGCSTLYFSYNMVITKINHVLIDDDVIANHTHQDSQLHNWHTVILQRLLRRLRHNSYSGMLVNIAIFV